jgi:hypothetical protein
MAGNRDLSNPEVRLAAEKIWNHGKVAEDERIPVWLDCDTGWFAKYCAHQIKD